MNKSQEKVISTLLTAVVATTGVAVATGSPVKAATKTSQAQLLKNAKFAVERAEASVNKDYVVGNHATPKLDYIVAAQNAVRKLSNSATKTSYAQRTSKAMSKAVQQLSQLTATVGTLSDNKDVVKVFIDFARRENQYVPFANLKTTFEARLAKAEAALNNDDPAEVAAETAAETAVAAYEKAPLTSATEVTAAEDLGTKATTAVAAVKNEAKNTVFTSRIAAQKAKVDAAKANFAALEVKSVTAINGNTVQVTFSKALDETTATTAANFSAIKLTTGAAYAFDYAELSADAKTVTLTNNSTNLTASTDYVLNVKGIKESGSSTALNFAKQFVSATDTTAPVINSVVATTGNSTTSTVTVNFNEAVDITGTHAPIFKVNGAIVAATQGTDKRTFTLQLPSPASAGASVAVDVSNLYDLAGNSGTASKTATVSSDLQAADVSSVEAVSDTVLKVTFSEKVDYTKLTTGSTGNVAVTADGMNDALTQVASDATGTALTANTNVVYLRLNAGTLYTTTIKSRNLNINFKNLTDAYGNVSTKDISKQVTISKDEVKPLLVSITHKKLTSGTHNTSTFLVKLSEKSTVGANLSLSLIDGDGVLSTVIGTTSYVDSTGTVVAGATSSDYILVTLPTDTLVANSNYRISVASGVFSDLATVANTNIAATVSTAVTDGQTASAASAPSVTGVSQVSPGVLQVTFDKAVTSSAVTATNYKLNNIALPADTLITLNTAKTVATINLPSGFVAKDNTNPVLTITGVKSTDGGQIASVSSTVTGGTILETVAPVLAKAEYTAANTVKVTFNEETGIQAGTTLTIYNGSTSVGTLTTTAVTDIADGTDDGVVTETLTVAGAGIDTLNQSGLTVKVLSGDLKDNNNNANSADVVVPLTDKATVATGTLSATYPAANQFNAKLTTGAVETGSTAYVYVAKATDVAINDTNYSQFTALATQSASNLVGASGVTFSATNDSLGAAVVSGGSYKVYVVIKDASGNIVATPVATVTATVAP